MRTPGFLFAIAAPMFVASLAHAGAPGTLDVATSDERGTILVDGSSVGVGAFHGDVAPGRHEIRVDRAGFKPYKKTVVVESGKTVSLSVVLEREEAAPPPPPPPAYFGGFYGGFFVGPSFEPAGSGSTWEQSCTLTGAVSCGTSAPGGVAIAGHVGYTWDPVGIEIFGAFGFDYTSPSATFDGVVQPGSNAALTGPPRVEQFRVARAGGMGALRARGTIDGKHIRVSFAGGAGFGYHAMAMERETNTTDGSNQRDVFAPPVVTYLTAALSFEASVAWRLSKSISITGGLSVWIESAGSGTVTLADPQHYLTTGDPPVPTVPLRTPSYHLAGGPQVFLWPFVGMQFGP
jgi:hypothetical protein